MKASDLIEGLQLIIKNFGDVEIFLPPLPSTVETTVVGLMFVKASKKVIICNKAVVDIATEMPHLVREYHA